MNIMKRGRQPASATALALILGLGLGGEVWAQQAAPSVTSPASPTIDPSAQPVAASPQQQSDEGTPSSAPAPELQGGDTAAQQASATMGTITVTATGTNITGVKPVGSETVTLDRQQILATGFTNTNDVLQTLPQVQNNGGAVVRQGGTSGYGGNPAQGTAINLRGIGASATLTLVDGHRVSPSGASNAFTEAIQVPIAAIQRIDVIADGASAIYGADAVSGVVNYVLRKDFSGVEISPRYTTNNIYQETGGSITVGHTWTIGGLGSGNFIFTADYDHRDRGLSSNSPYLSANLTRFGGPDTRQINGAVVPGNPGDLVLTNTGATSTTYQYYGLPANAGAGLTFANLNPTANVVDPAQYTDYLPDQKRTQLAAFVNQDLTPWLSVYYEGFYTHRLTITQQYGTNVGSNFTLCPTSPYYISGAPNTSATPTTQCAVAGGETIYHDFYKDIGPTTSRNPDTTYTNTFGFNSKLPFGWKSEGYFTYGADRTCGICNVGDNVNLAAYAQAVNNGGINPFSTAPLTPAQIAGFSGTNIQSSINIVEDGVVKFDGPLFSLPGGMVRAAFGGEYSYNHEGLSNGSNTNNINPADNTFSINNVANTNRKIGSTFGEIYVPVVGKAMGVPFMQQLDFDAAVRYDHYSDFGGTTNPKLGLTWKVDDDLSIRASWGTSFRAPALTDESPIVYSAEVVGIPTLNNSGNSQIVNGIGGGYTNIAEVVGNNASLQPEKATTWSAGFDFKPHWVSGLTLSMTYYNIVYKGQIASPPVGTFLSTPQLSALYSTFITPVNNPATCVAGTPSTYDPKLAKFLATTIADYKINVFDAGNPCQVNAILDGRETNLATTQQDGLDFEANYSFNTTVGRWSVGGSLTKILNDKQQSGLGVPLTSVLDTYFNPVSLRGRGQVGWAQGPFSVNVFVNYVGSYLNNTDPSFNGVTLPNETVSAFVTADIGLTYQVASDVGFKYLRGVRASMNILNFTNENPPTTITFSGSSGSAFDGNNANVLGRQFSFQVVKAF